MKCRHCNEQVDQVFFDLGSSPPSNAYLSKENLRSPERWIPLRVLVCESCWLVQTDDYLSAGELFSRDYAYFSSFSQSWLDHISRFVESVANRFNLTQASHVVEIAANDGYLLQYVKAMGIPCYGIEPTHRTAQAARAKGIEIEEDFFGIDKSIELVEKRGLADMIVANNVLAHVPDINDFVGAIPILLKPQGIATFEFPHLLNLVDDVQFDTIYHEHFSYLSLTAVQGIFECNGLTIFDVDELPTHGGSLRVYAQRTDSGRHSLSESVNKILKLEHRKGLNTINYYKGFQNSAEEIKLNLLRFLIDAKTKSQLVAAYGAAAKGNTMLNYAGVRSDLLSYVVDRNPEKQGKFMPGSRIPIVNENRLRHDKPDYILIIPWNLTTEIMNQLDYIKDWGGRFVVAVPHLEIL